MRRIYIFIAAFIISLIIFYNFYKSITTNQVGTGSDEFYWISTGKTAQMLWDGDIQNPLWHEEWGFTNFNGAKLIYGFGLMLFGHMDFDSLGHGSQTYYKWLDFSGKQFPSSHRDYTLIRDARLISAIWISVAIGILFLLSFEISDSIIPGLVGTVFVYNHPIISEVGTHVTYDGISLTIEGIVLLLFIHILKRILNKRKQGMQILLILTGIFLGLSISVKMNLILLYINIIGILILLSKIIYVRSEIVNVIILPKYILIITILMALSFLMINPNIIFYPEYSFIQMLNDRIRITTYHMSLFNNSPGHVLVSFPEKFLSFKNNIFTNIISPFFGFGLILTFINIYYSKIKFIKYTYGIFIIFGFMLFYEMMLYIPFNERRYYLPILPFILVISTYYLKYISIKIRQYLNSSLYKKI